MVVFLHFQENSTIKLIKNHYHAHYSDFNQKNTIKKGLEKKYKLQPSDLFFSQLGKKDEK